MKLKHLLIPFLVLPLIACDDDDDNNDPIEEMMPQSFKVHGAVHLSSTPRPRTMPCRLTEKA